MNPIEIDEKLLELCDLLEKQAKANFQYAREGAEAEATYRRELAKARLEVRAGATGKITVDQVDDEAAAKVGELHSEFLIKQAKHEAARDALFATRARLDAMRTVSAGNREAVK